jgi:hypothetical protein
LQFVSSQIISPISCGGPRTINKFIVEDGDGARLLGKKDNEEELDFPAP